MTEKSILIVEDEPMLREAFALMLQGAGYTVYGAGTGAEALELASAHKPALVLLDLGLPDVNGLEVARQLKASSAAVLVALTGRVGAEEKQACLDAGCTEYFAKPLSPREFLKKLPGLLGG